MMQRLLEFAFFVVPLFITMIVYKRREGITVIWGPMAPTWQDIVDSFSRGFSKGFTRDSKVG